MQTSADQRAAALVEGIASKSNSIGAAANELYALIWEGADANVLRPLLESEKVEIQTAAAWILAETSIQTHALLAYALPLSRHASKRIRAYIVDFIVNQRLKLNDDARRAVTILMQDDPDEEIREYAARQFSRAGIT